MLFTRIKNRHNVLMLQTPRSFCFTEKAFTRIVERLALKLLAQCHGFDGHNTANFRVFALIHDAHRAFAQLFFNLVATQHGFFNTAAVKQH